MRAGIRGIQIEQVSLMLPALKKLILRFSVA
jgi:hypothetical protein